MPLQQPPHAADCLRLLSPRGDSAVTKRAAARRVPPCRSNQQFTLAPGEAAAIELTGLRVQFVRVMADSRCPADAICIWVGDAMVHVRVFERRRDERLRPAHGRLEAVHHRARRHADLARATAAVSVQQPHDPAVGLSRDAPSAALIRRGGGSCEPRGGRRCRRRSRGTPSQAGRRCRTRSRA